MDHQVLFGPLLLVPCHINLVDPAVRTEGDHDGDFVKSAADKINDIHPDDIRIGTEHGKAVFILLPESAAIKHFVAVPPEWGVQFVSVTQEINTATSSGRMMLNIQITFSQYEREVIAERIRDKMSASRRKGKWVGGGVPFGYAVENKHLVIKEEDAEIVRRITATSAIVTPNGRLLNAPYTKSRPRMSKN